MTDNKKTEFKGIDAHEYFGRNASQYGVQYQPNDIAVLYPEHVFRLRIFLDLLKKIQPSRMLDIGCGSGQPLLAFLQNGYDAHGFDFSQEMVEESKKLLMSNGMDPLRITVNNMEDIQNIPYGYFDCIVGLGSLYYSRNFLGTIEQVASLIPKGGSLIFSLRNELFSLFSMNGYTKSFVVDNFVNKASLSHELRRKLEDNLDKCFEQPGVRKSFQTIDDHKVHSQYHNPLTIDSTIISPNGLALKGIYYYHFHALPPAFEHSDTQEFRKLSCQIENPTDWRGMFMASAFVVHAEKVG